MENPKKQTLVKRKILAWKFLISTVARGEIAKIPAAYQMKNMKKNECEKLFPASFQGVLWLQIKNKYLWLKMSFDG